MDVQIGKFQPSRLGPLFPTSAVLFLLLGGKKFTLFWRFTRSIVLHTYNRKWTFWTRIFRIIMQGAGFEHIFTGKSSQKYRIAHKRSKLVLSGAEETAGQNLGEIAFNNLG
jgi:hypothetical protein